MLILKKKGRFLPTIPTDPIAGRESPSSKYFAFITSSEDIAQLEFEFCFFILVWKLVIGL